MSTSVHAAKSAENVSRVRINEYNSYTVEFGCLTVRD